jgi:hypothetical protein
MRRGQALTDMAPALREGERQDTRKHTRHPLRPEAEAVADALDGRIDWDVFADRYRATIIARREADPAPYDAIAELARERDVFLGCSCPTRKQPDVHRCHTVLALTLMAEWYPDLDVRLPE